MVGITIQNRVNQNVKPIGITIRRNDDLAGNVIWNLVEKISQSNSRFNAVEKLIVTLHSVWILAGFDRGMKNKGRPLSVIAQLKTSVVEVKATENCLVPALIIAIAKSENDPDYKAYRQGRKIRPVVHKLLAKTGTDLSGGGRIPKLIQ